MPQALRAFVCSLALAAGPVSARAGDDGRRAPESLTEAFRPPAHWAGDFGPYRSPLLFDDGRPVRTAAEWGNRRREILKAWHDLMGPWPPKVERPALEILETTPRENFRQSRVRLRVAPDRMAEGYWLVPTADPGVPKPAVLVVYYEPETAIGLGQQPGRDFALQLARRGFAALSIGADPYSLDPARNGLALQPLSYLAYVASNAFDAIASRPEVDARRVGVLGHSYGGKWALFAACLEERFACGVWSDPGIVFDEGRANVNYWEPWYLGWEPGQTRARGVLTPEKPRIGAYKRLVESGRDLHELQALMAPRLFLVSGGSEDSPERWRSLNHVVAVNNLLGAKTRVAMTNRPGHTPTEESNEQICEFLRFALRPAPGAPETAPR